MLAPTEVVTRGGRPVCIRQAMADDAPALIAAVDVVSREGAYLLRSRFCPEEAEERAFLGGAAERGDLVLLGVAGDDVVGWLTLRRAPQDYRRHTASLGIGVAPPWRGQGLGTALIRRALEWAAEAGLERVELTVRASNTRAWRLYERLGFVEEGRAVRAVKDDAGRYDDTIMMACWLGPR